MASDRTGVERGAIVVSRAGPGHRHADSGHPRHPGRLHLLRLARCQAPRHPAEYCVRRARTEPHPLLRQLRGAAAAAGAGLQQRRAQPGRARGGHGPRRAQPAAPHPGAERGGAARRGALPRHRLGGRGHRPVHGRPEPHLRRRRPLPRLLRLPAGQARGAEPAGQHHPRVRRHPHVHPPDHDPQPDAHLLADGGQRGAAGLQPDRHHVRAQPGAEPRRLRHQQRDRRRCGAPADHRAGRGAQLRRAVGLPAGPPRHHLGALRHPQLPARPARLQVRGRVPPVHQRELPDQRRDVHLLRAWPTSRPASGARSR